MSYLKFDKEELVNLEYSLQREFLRTNRSGAYSSSTLAGCNTRKYHGMLVVQLDELDGGKHLLLSSLDESIIQHDANSIWVFTNTLVNFMNQKGTSISGTLRWIPYPR